MKKLLPSVKTWTTTVMVFLFAAFAQKSFGQVGTSYSYTTNNTSSLSSDFYGNAVGSFTQLVGAGNDDLSSAVTNIGFTFIFNATSYTQFSVSSNGVIELGGTAVSSL